MHNIKTAIGLMSGTSMDGIDAALLRSDGKSQLDILAHDCLTYPPSFRADLKNALQDADAITTRTERPGNLENIERQLTLYHVALVRNLLLKEHKTPDDIDLIGFHGQTVLHRPHMGLTVQLGDGALLAKETGIDVIFDMRSHDMAHGGQGAPLVPAYHRVLAEDLATRGGGGIQFPVVFVNIGGIANLTYIQKRGLDNDPIAFDCGPGNCLIDQWMEKMAGQSYDDGGMAGLAGRCDDKIVAAYLDHPFFHLNKTHALDWRDFAPLSPDSGLSWEDGAATLSFVTAAGIFHFLRLLPEMPKNFIISGGGSKNRAIMAALHQLAGKRDITILTAQECGLNADFMEAEAWGYLAIRARHSLPLTFPTTTGVSQALSGGILAQKCLNGLKSCAI